MGRHTRTSCSLLPTVSLSEAESEELECIAELTRYVAKHQGLCLFVSPSRHLATALALGDVREDLWLAALISSSYSALARRVQDEHVSAEEAVFGSHCDN